MCLVAFAIGESHELPLLVAANRDESYHRQTQGLSAWRLDNGVDVLAGRDLLAGGTWMGVGQNGRVALLTNIRPSSHSNKPAPAAQSRGALCSSWLGGMSWPAWLDSHCGHAFGGCNVVLGDLNLGTWHFARNQASPAHAWHPSGWYTSELTPGIYGLSNADLDTPWPKLLQLKSAMAMQLQLKRQPSQADVLTRAAHDMALRNKLVEALRDDTRLTQDPLSSVFVRWPQASYGTRSSTLMWVEQATLRTAHMAEWRFDDNAQLLTQPKRLDMLTCAMPTSINGSPTTEKPNLL
ncbi:MAG: hypothetical protein ACJA1Y_001660 [Burkholderiaceae bacterium]|jgi:uncharacterized protein with NRDE domain